MGENILIPIENVETFSADLLEIAEELEQRRSNVAGILSELYETWSGTGKGAFQESAESQDARFGRILKSFQYAQGVFAKTVIPGLHSLQLMASRLGAAFDVGGESDVGTLKLSESSNLSSEKTAIQEAALDAAQYFTAALNSLSLVSSTAVSSEGILAIKKTTEENAKRFETFTSGFQDYKNSVRLFCRGLRESFGVLSASDEYRNVLLGFDPSLLDSAGQQLWAEAMYQFCMKDDNVWKKILGKPADEISPTEYALLASVYATLDPEKLDDFLTECMVCTDNYKGDSYAGSHEYSMWVLDNSKIDNIMLYTSLLYAVTLEQLRNTPEAKNPNYWSEEYNQALEINNQIMQRNVLLNEMSIESIFYGHYQKPVTFSITCDSDNNLIVDYEKLHTYSYNEYVSMPNGYGFSSGFYVPHVETHLMPEKITIGEVLNGKSIKYEGLDIFEDVASSHFGIGQAAVSFADDTLRGKITEYSLELAGKAVIAELKLSGKAAQFVPIVGDIISIGADLGFALYDAKQDTAFIHAEVDKLREECIYSDFDCNGVFVTRDSYNSSLMPEQTVSFYVEEGRETRLRIDVFNDSFPDSNISVSALLDPQAYSQEALKSDNSIYNIIRKAADEKAFNGVLDADIDD